MKFFYWLLMVILLLPISCAPSGPFENWARNEGIVITWEIDFSDDRESFVFYWHVKNEGEETVNLDIFWRWTEVGDKSGFGQINVEVAPGQEKSGRERSKSESGNKIESARMTGARVN